MVHQLQFFQGGAVVNINPGVLDAPPLMVTRISWSSATPLTTTAGWILALRCAKRAPIINISIILHCKCTKSYYFLPRSFPPGFETHIPNHGLDQSLLDLFVLFLKVHIGQTLPKWINFKIEYILLCAMNHIYIN